LAKRRRKRVMAPHWWEGLPGDGHGGLVQKPVADGFILRPRSF
jgi:hypothetical protein